jgi:hypothetical protein
MKTILTGEVNNDIEPFPTTFKGLCDSPLSLLSFILKSIVFSVDVENKIIIQEEKPTGADKKLLWIKTSWPYGIGMMIEGEYKMDYGMCGFPVNTPFLHASIAQSYDGLKKLTDSELGEFGIAPTTGTSANKMFWYLLTPPNL